MSKRELQNQVMELEIDICYLQRHMDFFPNAFNTYKEIEYLQTQRQKLVNQKG